MKSVSSLVSSLQKFFQNSICNCRLRSPKMYFAGAFVIRRPHAVRVKMSARYSMTLDKPLLGSEWF
jgi:hypothetical protein